MARVAVAVLLAVVLSAGLANGSPAKGDGPTTIAAGYGSVWIGTGSGEVVRVDARSRRVTHRLLQEHPTRPGFVHALSIGFGLVWIAQGRYDTLKRLDPRTHAAVDIRPRRGWTATLVASGAGAVWVGDFERDTVFRVEPATNRVSAAVRVPGRARLWGLAAGPAGVWVVTVPGARVTPTAFRQVRRLDTLTNRIGAPILESKCDVALAVGSQRLWVSDLCAGTVTPVGRTIGAPVPVGQTAVSLAVGGGAVWVLGQVDGVVKRIDPRTTRVTATVRVRGSSLAAGADAVWVLDLGDGEVGFVRAIDPGTNRVVGRPIRIASR